MSYDLIIIGAGPGGYVAAVEAAKLGKHVAVIEKNLIGGTCLNVGCIPSKAYLKHASWIEQFAEADLFGINSTVSSIDFSKLVSRKNAVVSQLQQGINYLFKQNKIDFIEGEAEIISPKQIKVNQQIYETEFVLLATGSSPFVPPIDGLSEQHFLTTDTFFSLESLPKKLTIIGGGVIGIELAFAMAPLGVSVTIIEAASDILATEDPSARELIKQKLTKKQVNVIEAAVIKKVQKSSIVLADQTISHDELLVVTGRHADLTLPKALSLELTENQRFVDVNRFYQTSIATIYAVGDIIDSYMLAHAASKEGVKAVRHMFGKKEDSLKNKDIPRCVYTHPEIASFGLSEEEAKLQGYDVLVSQIPYSSNGRAISGNATEGFIKIISEHKYHEILGAVIVGENATELIHTLLAVKNSEGCLEEIEKMTFAHPTLSEMMGELANGML
ncbi:dihydrolipoyl dehydrogenase [Vagococcus vulneris]|uniref:Dihydrolipoyl dehydrogenase n=1 Tax=Vagococcus vulneris TaxID=1977869 RepID=A0A430A1P5_9ENTE|nr:dihydrolipoyl dehydrogenase [Vagococcus vulneris]RSU00259.1 dihydrolipoyl dehydrogenase [Vagococcus vulneris]